MITTSRNIKHHVVLLGLVATMIVGGDAPILGSSDAAAKDKQRDRPEQRAELATTVRRFENTAVRLGIIDGVGTIATSSAIEVSGLSGTVVDVDVNLIGISHGPTSTQDIDVLLIGPGGRSALILSDVGGNTATTDVTLVLDDQQPDQLPSASALKNGFFQPTNVGSPDTMNLGAGPVTPPSGASLGVFNGINPNGTWRLWAYDDEPNGSSPSGGGINGGWAVTITTAEDEPGAPMANRDRHRARAGKRLTVSGPGVLGNDSDPDGDSLRATVALPPQKGSLALQPDGSFTYKPSKRARGADSFTYLAQDPSGLSGEATVDIQIKAAKGKGGKKHRR